MQQLQSRLPCLITILEGVNEIRVGSLTDALKAARAKLVRWSAQDAGVEDITKCGLRGSPTIVKKVFAPQPRAKKAEFIELGDKPGEALVEALFQRQTNLESALEKLARGY